MKTLKVIYTIVTMVAVMATGAVAQINAENTDLSDYKPVSEIKAAQYSLMGTLLPIAAGIVCWKMQDPDSPYDYENPGRVIPVLLITSGVVLGPSVGYYYGKCPKRGTTGILIRVGTGALTVVAAGAAASSQDSDGFMDFSAMEAAITAGVIGSGIIVVEALVDLALVKSTVENKNLETSRKPRTGVSLYPRYFADSNAGGLQLQVTF